MYKKNKTQKNKMKNKIKLSTGNDIFFYNGKQYINDSYIHGIGWIILDSNNPSQIVARSDKPLITAKYPWEIGTQPYTCVTQNRVYIEAAVPIPDSYFLLIECCFFFIICFCLFFFFLFWFV